MPLLRVRDLTLFDQMDAAVSPSKSKLRRIRAISTKRKLFESASKSDALVGIQSQIAMLTSSIDYLISTLFASPWNGFNHHVYSTQQPYFEPPVSVPTEPVARYSDFPSASIESKQEEETEPTCHILDGLCCQGCWEPLLVHPTCEAFVLCWACKQVDLKAARRFLSSIGISGCAPLWGESEIQTWTRATVRAANDGFCQLLCYGADRVLCEQLRRDLLLYHWNTVRVRLPLRLRTAILNILLEEKPQIPELPCSRSER